MTRLLKIYFILSFAISLSSNAYAQQTSKVHLDTIITAQINPKLEPVDLHFQIKRHNISEDVYDQFNVYQVRMLDQNSSIIQSIKDTLEYCCRPEFGLRGHTNWLVDINFDSYLDIPVKIGQDFSGYNAAYDFWIFDPTRSFFYKDKDFSGLVNPYLDSENKEISSFINGGWRSRELKTYKVIEGKLILKERVEFETILGEDGEDYLITKRYELTNGELKLVEQSKERH